MERINLTLENKPNYFKLYSDCTIYTQFHKLLYFELDLNQLQKERKQLKKELRNKGVKVSTKINDNIFKNFSNEFYIKLGEYKILSENVEKLFIEIYEKGLYSDL